MGSPHERRRVERNDGIFVRLGAPYRSGAVEIESLPIRLPSGAVAPLSQFARLEMASGPAVIRRENVTRRLAVDASIAGRDLGSVVADLRERIASAVPLPDNYYVDYGGQFERQQQAFDSLMVAVVFAVAIVVVLLFWALGTFSEVGVILPTLPDAFVGGIVALLVMEETLNVSSAVGFIGLLGIAVQNGLVLIAQTRPLVAQGQPFAVALRTASIGRVRPKLMTAGCAILGLLPSVLPFGEGGELERPLAAVMIGGLITSTLFTLLALPTFYSLVARVAGRLDRMQADRPAEAPDEP